MSGIKLNRHRAKLYQLIPTNFTHQTKEFFSNSTLHGVRYIAEKGRPFGEKLMWFCCVAIGAVAAFVIIGSLWEKFQTNPTITGLDTDFHDQELIFPSVTVCPLDPNNMAAVNATAYQTLSNYEPNYDEYFPLLESLPQLSYETIDEAYKVFKDTTANLDNTRKLTLRQFAFKLAKTCEELFVACKFRGDIMACCPSFKPVYSERGFCYSFNARYYGMEDDEIKNSDIEKIKEIDKKWALTFALTTSSLVYLHSVEEVFSLDTRPQFLWEEENFVDLLITMKQTYTTDDAEQLTIGQRKCIFEGEVDLDYYKNDIYSFSTCMKQCRMEKANRLCKCIPPFYQPTSKKYKQCTLSEFECLSKHRSNITTINGCTHCELSCLNTVYESEKFSSNMSTVTQNSHKQEDFHVNIEFLTWPIIRYKREVLFGWVDLLVSFGGIAGLFLGFSLLSGVEIIYYFTMRAGCMFVKNRETLYELQHEKETRPQPRFDLSLQPQFKSLNDVGIRRHSSSMSNIQIVRPVADDGMADNLEAPINTEINRFDFVGRLQKDVKRVSDKKIVPWRKNIFHPLQDAPYATRIKPLDRNFKFRSRSEGPADVIFYGYLP